MISKEMTNIKEVKYFEKEFKHILTCDNCGDELYSGDSKDKLHDKEKECYKVVKPIYGKMGVEGEKVLHFCGTNCYNNFLSKEFMHIVQIPGVETRYDGDF